MRYTNITVFIDEFKNKDHISRESVHRFRDLIQEYLDLNYVKTLEDEKIDGVNIQQADIPIERISERAVLAIITYELRRDYWTNMSLEEVIATGHMAIWLQRLKDLDQKKSAVDYRGILARYQYEDDSKIRIRIMESDGTNQQENRDIINEISLWKLNRSIHIENDIIVQIKELDFAGPLEAANEQKVKDVCKKLLESKGIKIAMASTILKMYHPNIFPIIDQRAYQELYDQSFPTFYSKDAKEKYTDIYIDYMRKCYEFWQAYCPEILFSNVDKLIYQLNKEKGC